VTRLESLACPIFAQDCEDPNPLIRALAVRTMGCIRVDKITEYLCEPLRKCLKDEDPYVRKTAAVCVAKLYDINAALVEDQGFLDQLKDLLSDSNPMVHKSLCSLMKFKQKRCKKLLGKTSKRDLFQTKEIHLVNSARSDDSVNSMRIT